MQQKRREGAEKKYWELELWVAKEWREEEVRGRREEERKKRLENGKKDEEKELIEKKMK